jgi:UDP-3-O-[3-hydroxymyristoyl] glucosamine N-acyltransferase
MADARFFPSAGPFTLLQIAEIARLRLPANCDVQRRFTGIGPLDSAAPEHVTFFESRRYAKALATTRAGACIVAPRDAARVPATSIALQSEAPQRSFAALAAAFHPERRPAPGIDPRAVVDASARLGTGVVVEAGAVIGARAEIGADVWIEPNAVIGADVAIGAQSRIGANASISHALIGARVRILPGARIGQDGFGFALGKGLHQKIPQLGRVVIGDDVEVGANATIDRGAMDDTVIGAGTVIDNLVQIGHNVRIGRGCVIVAQTGISGSTRLDDGVMLGGQVGLGGHLRIGAGAQAAPRSGIIRDVAPSEAVMGYPAMPLRHFLRLAEKWRREGRRLSQGTARAERDED